MPFDRAITAPTRILVALAVALAVLGGLIVLATLGPASAGQAPRSTSGIVSAVNGWAAERLPQPELNWQLGAMRAHGVRVVRADAPWPELEPDPPGPRGPGWHFSGTDAWVTALATHDLTWEPIIDGSVGWACGGLPLLRYADASVCPPVNNAQFAAFARAVAARYGGGGSFWAQHPVLPYRPARIFEIWNEENAPPHELPPAEYASVYAAARSEIHAVDPQASVIVGGLASGGSDDPSSYVSEMFAADPNLRGRVDGFGLHPYAASAAAVEQWVADFRRTVDSQGEARAPIDVTELGWTYGDPAWEAWRASTMRAVARVLSRSNCGIRLLAPYDWINPGALPADDYGFVDNTGADTSLRPAGAAWFGGLRRAGKSPEIGLCGPVRRKV